MHNRFVAFAAVIHAQEMDLLIQAGPDKSASREGTLPRLTQFSASCLGSTSWLVLPNPPRIS